MKMKFLVTLLGVLMFSGFASAQLKYGGGLSYGTEIESVGLNLRGDYSISEKLSVVGGLNYFLPKEESIVKSTMWTLNADGHYGFNDMFYGLAGLNYATINVEIDMSGVGLGKIDESTSEVGLNIGAGANFGGMFFAEGKYVVSEYDQLVLTVGILFGGK